MDTTDHLEHVTELALDFNFRYPGHVVEVDYLEHVTELALDFNFRYPGHVVKLKGRKKKSFTG